MAEDLSETVAKRLGARCNIYRASAEAPEAAAALWRFAESAYLDNPLPFLFKERLFVYLSRFCSARYCIARHVGCLSDFGGTSGNTSLHRQPPSEIIKLLRKPLAQGETLDRSLRCLEVWGFQTCVPDPGTPEESGIFACAAHIYLQTRDSARCQHVLQRSLEFPTIERLTMLMAYIRAEHARATMIEIPLEPDLELFLKGERDLSVLLMRGWGYPTSEDGVGVWNAKTETPEELSAFNEPQKTSEDLGREVTQLRRANVVIADSHRAALNLLEDAVQAREKAEEATGALAVSEQRFRSLVEGHAQAVWETNAEGKDIVDSSSWRSYTGQTFRDWSEHGWLEVIHPDDRESAERLWQEAVASGGSVDAEFRMRFAGGGYRWTNMRASPIYGTDGKIIKWSGMNIDIDARKMAEERLRMSEEKYHGLFESIDEGFCIVEMIFDEEGKAVDYRFLEANPAFEIHTGLKDAVGMTVRERAPEHETYWFEIYGEIARTGSPQRFTQRADALGRYFDVYAFRVGLPEENLVAILFRDIGERMRREESAALLAAIASEFAEMTGLASTLERLTERIGRHFGVQQCVIAEFEDLEILTVTHGWRDGGPQTIQSPCRLHEILSEEQFATCVAGGPAIVSDSHADPRVKLEGCKALGIRSLVAIPSMRDGRAVLMLSIGSDVARQWRPDEVDLLKEVSSRIWASVERARTEDALRQSEERLRLIVENARDYAIFSMDLDRKVTSWNSGAEALLGYTQDEILGRSCDVIFSSEDRLARAPQIEADTAILRGRASDERWHIRKNGSPFWGSGVMMAMHDGDGRTVGLVKIFRDVTETRAAQRAVEESKAELVEALRENEIARREVEAASRAKDHFLAVLSHELRTPLAPVILTTMTLQRRTDLAEPVSKGLELIRRNVQLECHLIDDLLDLTRIAHGKLEIAREAVDLHEAIQAAVDISQPDLDFKKQQLALKLEADRSVVIGDTTRLQQLIWNLLKNASKFTPNNGSISVTTKCSGERIIVRVADSGAGIRPERLAVIFEAFTQAEHSTFSEYGGLGLGLAIAKATVEAHQGTIEASSAGPGQGSDFFFQIPLAPASPSP